MIYFHIGHHKTATTWLQSGLLKEHPNVQLLNNPRKPWSNSVLSELILQTERSFDTAKTREKLLQEINSVCNCVSKVYSAERLSGHPINGGVDSFRTAKRLHSLCPDAKIIIGVRSQFTMLKSIYTQLVKAGYHDSFSSLVDSTGWKAPSFNLDFFEYDHIVSYYQSLFGAQNVFVMFYEDLLIDRKRFITHLLDFMELSYFEPSNFDMKENSSQSVDLQTLVKNNNLKQLYKCVKDLNIDSSNLLELELEKEKEITTSNELFTLSFDINERYGKSNSNLFKLLNLPERGDYPISY